MADVIFSGCPKDSEHLELNSAQEVIDNTAHWDNSYLKMREDNSIYFTTNSNANIEFQQILDGLGE